MPKYKHFNQYILPVGRKVWTDKKYFDKFFELNQERIEYVNRSYGNGRKTDKEKIYNRLKADEYVYDIPSFKETLLRNLAHGTEFRTYKEIATDNVMQGLETFGKLDMFYQAITMPDGTMNYNPALLDYVGNNSYLYDNRVFIDFTNSPADVRIVVMENEDYEPNE